MLVTITSENPEPLYQQIVDQVRRLILTGALAPGEPLPSIRELAQQLTTSVITTRRAYAELEREGLITTRPGLGSFVARVDVETARAGARRAAAAALARAVAEARKLGLGPDEIREAFNHIMEGGMEHDHGPRD